MEPGALHHPTEESPQAAERDEARAVKVVPRSALKDGVSAARQVRPERNDCFVVRFLGANTQYGPPSARSGKQRRTAPASRAAVTLGAACAGRAGAPSAKFPAHPAMASRWGCGP